MSSVQNVYVFNGDNAYARFAQLLTSLINQVTVVISRDGKKGLSKCDAITPSLIGYRHTSSGDAERNIKLIEFDDGTTFHLFGCDRSTKDTKSWGNSTVYTYTSLAVFISGLEAEHEYPFSDPTKRHGEELDTFRLLGKKGLRLLGLTPKAIKRLEDSMKFE